VLALILTQAILRDLVEYMATQTLRIISFIGLTKYNKVESNTRQGPKGFQCSNRDLNIGTIATGGNQERLVSTNRFVLGHTAGSLLALQLTGSKQLFPRAFYFILLTA